jgi:branched-chain amino acid transport system ATP-binding protein
MTNLLTVGNLSAGYGQATVIRDISFAVSPGEVMTVLGANGAGKSTLLLCMAGFIRPKRGSISLEAQDLTRLAPYQVSNLGVCLVPDDRGLSFELSVAESLRISRRAAKSRRTRRESAADLDRALGLFPRLTGLMKREVGLLSGGEQQMLAIARALTASPRVLLVDEASLGLAPQLVAELMPAIRLFAKESSAAVVIVEQHYQLALKIADKAIVLSHGRPTLSGSGNELLRDPKSLERAYFGELDTTDAGTQ